MVAGTAHRLASTGMHVMACASELVGYLLHRRLGHASERFVCIMLASRSFPGGIVARGVPSMRCAIKMYLATAAKGKSRTRECG